MTRSVILRRLATAACLVLALSVGLAACAGCDDDPYKCGPDDIDGDGDGRCNE
jgi:hypothetical protein